LFYLDDLLSGPLEIFVPILGLLHFENVERAVVPPYALSFFDRISVVDRYWSW
jgi:hypothetical protein